MKNKLNKFITGSLLAILLAGGFASAQTSTPAAEMTTSSYPVVLNKDGGYKGYGMIGNWYEGRNNRDYNENDSWINMMPAFAAGFVGLGIFVGILGFLLVAFWAWMLVHAASSDIKDKPLWLLVIWFMNIIGAIIYFFVIKRQYDREMKECGCESCACDDSEATCACGKNDTCQCHEETHDEHHQK